MKKIKQRNLIDSIVISLFVGLSLLLCTTASATTTDLARRKRPLIKKPSESTSTLDSKEGSIQKKAEQKHFYDINGKLMLISTERNQKEASLLENSELILTIKNEMHYIIKS